MKIIHLMRHAKAEENLGGEDKERRLVDRGIAAAKAMGRYIAEQKLPIDLIFCSDAVRTKQTAEQLTPFLPKQKLQLDGALYHASAAMIVDQVSQLPEIIQHLMVVGHNPGLHELAAKLARAGDEKLVDKLSLHYPTGAISSFELAIDSWSDFSLHSKARLVRFVTPDDLDHKT